LHHNGSNPAFGRCSRHFRLAPVSGIRSALARCLSRANKRNSFDHLVGAGEDRRRQLTVPLTLPWDETFDIGADTGTPVNDQDYQVPFRFTGTINKLTISIEPPKLTPADVAALKTAEAKANDAK